MSPVFVSALERCPRAWRMGPREEGRHATTARTGLSTRATRDAPAAVHGTVAQGSARPLRAADRPRGAAAPAGARARRRGTMSDPIGDRGKIKATHLARLAFVYVRQSSPQQVRYNVESKRRQYDFAAQVEALGGAATGSSSSTRTRDGAGRFPMCARAVECWNMLSLQGLARAAAWCRACSTSHNRGTFLRDGASSRTFPPDPPPAARRGQPAERLCREAPIPRRSAIADREGDAQRCEPAHAVQLGSSDVAVPPLSSLVWTRRPVVCGRSASQLPRELFPIDGS